VRKRPGSDKNGPYPNRDGPADKERDPRRKGRKGLGETRRSLSNAVLSATLAVVVVQAIPLGGPGPNPPPSPTSSAQARPSPSSSQSARPDSPSGPSVAVPLRDLLDGLSIHPEGRQGYARSSFKHWIDSNKDGCDTRRDVLIRDGIPPPTIAPPCILVGGAWDSQYDGLPFDDPRGLDIDHVVPLAEAWRSGASDWTSNRRSIFANDLDVPWALVAVSATSNRSKRDQDPAHWMPSLESARCGYVRMWIQVKARWKLAVDDLEFNTLRNVVNECEPIDGEYVPAA
jgi:hypothetical protein